MTTGPLTVACRASDGGWSCDVTVGDDPGATRHRVLVRTAEMQLAAGEPDPSGLVRRSFEYLLAREPRESILREFELGVIERYFPGWRAEVAPPGR